MTFLNQLLSRSPGIVRAEARKADLEQAAFQRASKGRVRPKRRLSFVRVV